MHIQNVYVYTCIRDKYRHEKYEKDGTVMICREGKVVSPQEIGMDTVEVRKHFSSTGIGTNVPRQVVTLIKRRLIRLSK